MNRWKSFVSCGIILSFSIAVFIMFGCEDNAVSPDNRSLFIDVLIIICNPLAPAPGDIARLTVQAIYNEGMAASGNQAVPAAGEGALYDWVVDAGSLIVDEGISVTWKVPDTAGVFHVKVVASLDQSTDTLEKDIMVRNFDDVNWQYNVGGEVLTLSTALAPKILSDGFYSIGHYRYKYDPEYKYHVIQKSGMSANCKTACNALVGGDHFRFHTDVNRILCSMIMNYSGYFRRQRMDVWTFPTLGFGSPVNITRSDESDLGTPQQPSLRKNEHVYPWGNQNLDMVVWQQNIAGERLDGTEDLTNIGFSNAARWNSPWNEGEPPTFMTLTQSYYIKITYSQGELDTVRIYYRNIRPLMTPQKDYVIYFVDSTGTFEPCMIPIVGNEPDTTQRSALMIDPDHGIFWEHGIEVAEKTVFQWNPDGDVVGFIDQKRHLFLFDYAAESVERMTNVGKVSEFAWSPDGSQVAAVSDEGVLLASPAGVGRIIFEKEKSTDDIIGLNWSTDPGDLKLGFRMLRKGKTSIDSWSSIIVWSDIAGMWYYATPLVYWPGEPGIDDYTWLRVVFESDNDGFYAPIPVADIPGKDVVIYHSYK